MYKFNEDFSSVTETDWRELTEKFIKGANFDETLVRRTEDGIAKGPLFTAEDTGNAVPLLKNEQPHLDGRPWHIGALVDYPDIKTANLDVLEELKGGASSVLIKPGAGEAHGVAIRSKNDVQRLLSGVHANLVPINLMPSENNFEVAALLASHFKSDPNLSDIHVSLGYAPDYAHDRFPELANWIIENANHWKAFSVNARAAHEAGGSPAQELALMLSQGCSYISALKNSDMDVDTALSLIDVYLASDQDSHQNIIKLRAARLLWSKMTESFGASAKMQHANIHAISSERMMAAQDPWSNMIRLSAASFGAICGGADTITLLPFTQALGLATPFAKRMSRNIQLMMMEESHLGHVSDPAHGSFMHEQLSYKLAEKAWEIFQHMQTLTLSLDWLSQEIAKTHAERTQKIENKDILLVGVNQFAKPDVRKAEVRKTPKIKARTRDTMSATSFEDMVEQADEGHLIPILEYSELFKPIRFSEKFDNAGEA